MFNKASDLLIHSNQANFTSLPYSDVVKYYDVASKLWNAIQTVIVVKYCVMNHNQIK